jgi:D-alanyl-lipoteichoic acid acyltransferase DltB (MBOAT superfamily)
MPSEFRLILSFLLYPLVAAVVLAWFKGPLRTSVFALVNVFGSFGLILVSFGASQSWWLWRPVVELVAVGFSLYFIWVVLHFLLVRRAVQSASTGQLALFFPILMLVMVKYGPAVSGPLHGITRPLGGATLAEAFIGLSYMAFRLSHLAMEVRNELVPVPTFAEYLSFAFFVPTISIGPISPYRIFWHSLHKPDRSVTPVGRSLFRMLIGGVKYLLLASLVQQLSYGALLRDGHPHPPIDLPVAAIAFCLYLYLNFSGYCDLAIGSAGLLGIEVPENFDHPFTSRNIQEFWNRWHITLSHFMRDMVFSPLCKTLITRFGPGFAPHAIGISIFMVFLLMGAWHGLAWNFIIYGCLHGLGVAGCHYYTLALKKRLGKKGYAAYMANRWIRWASTSITFLFVTGTLLFFANSMQQIREFWLVLR